MAHQNEIQLIQANLNNSKEAFETNIETPYETAKKEHEEKVSAMEQQLINLFIRTYPCVYVVYVVTEIIRDGSYVMPSVIAEEYFVNIDDAFAVTSKYKDTNLKKPPVVVGVMKSVDMATKILLGLIQKNSSKL